MNTLKPHEIPINQCSIDTCLWHIQREIMSRHGVDASYRMMDPLNWYINTGRASMTFLRCLINSRPVLVARDLAKGGSHEEIINRVCNRIGFKRETF